MKKRYNKISKAYTESTVFRIFEVYQRPDSEKYNKYVSVLRAMEEMDGWGFKIIHHNAYNYSCGFLYMDSDKNIKLRYFASNGSVHDYKFYV